MEFDASTRIGHVVDVQGSQFVVSLDFTDPAVIPTVTVGDEDVLVGRIGSYVAVIQSSHRLLCIVNRSTEQEMEPGPIVELDEGALVGVAYARRMLRLSPVGSLTLKGEWERGVTYYPTTGAEVHVVNGDVLSAVFAEYKEFGVAIGDVTSIPEQSVYIDPTKMLGRHFAILGQTGSGKSWTVASILQGIVKSMPNAHIILLDLHGEYSWVDHEGVRHTAFSDSAARYIDARDLEVPYWMMSFSELCDLLIDNSEFSAHNQLSIFRDVVGSLKHVEGMELHLEKVSVDTPIYFSLEVLKEKIKEINEAQVEGQRGPKNGPHFGSFDSFLMRLDSKLNDIRYDFLLKPRNHESSQSLSSLLRDFVGLGEQSAAVTILDLSSVPFDVRPIATAQLGRLAFEFNYWNPRYREFPILLICEEAHAYIPQSPSSNTQGSRKSMERIAKEGRKYGVGLGVVSQRPHEVSETVLAQCGTFVCLRLTNPDDQRYVRGLFPDSEGDLTGVLSSMGRGEALILGEAVSVPTRVSIYRPDPCPNSDDIDFYENWTHEKEAMDVEEVVARWRKQERN
jgi:hypothetical protein